MAKFIMLIGIPAAGKDTWANKYVKENPNTIIHSSDNIREELYGNQSIQGDPNKIFEMMRSRAINDLCAGKDIIYNATNVSYRDRKSIIADVKKLNLKIELIAKVFATPIEECKRRNNLRDRQVPDYVYDKMLKKWKTPCEWEGFDKIEVVKEETENIVSYLTKMIGFDQKNQHHTLSLFEHSKLTQNYLLKYPNKGKNFWIIEQAGLYHDIGKLFTQSEPDENGNCHYYGHEGYSSYITLCCGFLESSQLIAYHMIPYSDGKKTWRERMSKIFWKKLQILHEADKEAH